MKNPSHSGQSIKDACLDSPGLSVRGEIARPRHRPAYALPRSERPRGHLARDGRLEKAGWSNADHWPRLQMAHDLAQARQHEREIKVERYGISARAPRGRRHKSNR